MTAHSQKTYTSRPDNSARVVKPILDLYLEDYVEEFRGLKKLLPRLDKDRQKYKRAVFDLCELSRDMLLRLLPISHSDPAKVKEILLLLRQAAEKIDLTACAEDKEVMNCRDRILRRANDLAPDSEGGR